MPHTNTIHSTTTNKMLSSLLLVAAFLQIHPIVAAIPRQPSRGLPIRSNHHHRGSSFLWGTRKHDDPSPLFSSSALLVPRGGDSSTAATDEDDGDDNDGKEKDKEDEEDEEDEEDSSDNKKSITSTKPLVILIKSNLDSKVLDIHPMELNAIRARNVESVKSSLARQLPGKPPLDLIRLSLDGRVLRDELLMDELLDDDDDEDDDDDATDPNKPALTLVLDMVPPVDPRTFGQELEDRMEEMSTSDLLDAYTLNEAAIWFSSQFVVSRKGEADNSAEPKEDEDDEDEEATPPTPSSDSDPLIAFQLRQYATHLKSQLQTTLISEKTAPLLEDPIPPAQAAAEQARTPQIKGDRFRPAVAASISSSTAAASAAGGTLQSSSSSVVGLKQNVQHYLNINWGETIRNFCLFLFFGWFGGRTVTSRALLLLGAPMCFVIQARPVKLFYKEVLYFLLRNPPGIVLSLLPAPQQAMLALKDEDAMRMIYGDDAPAAPVAGGASLNDDNVAVEGEDDDELEDIPNTMDADEEEEEYEEEETSDDEE